MQLQGSLEDVIIALSPKLQRTQGEDMERLPPRDWTVSSLESILDPSRTETGDAMAVLEDVRAPVIVRMVDDGVVLIGDAYCEEDHLFAAS